MSSSLCAPPGIEGLSLVKGEMSRCRSDDVTLLPDRFGCADGLDVRLRAASGDVAHGPEGSPGLHPASNCLLLQPPWGRARDLGTVSGISWALTAMVRARFYGGEEPVVAVVMLFRPRQTGDHLICGRVFSHLRSLTWPIGILGSLIDLLFCVFSPYFSGHS